MTSNSLREAVERVTSEEPFENPETGSEVVTILAADLRLILSAIPAPVGGDRERIARVACDAFSDGNAQLDEVPAHQREQWFRAADAILALSAPGGALQSEREGR